MAEGHFTIQIFTDSICCIICNIALFDNSQITNYKWYKIHLTQMLNLFHWCSDFAIHSSLQCTAFIIFTFIHLRCQMLPAVPMEALPWVYSMRQPTLFFCIVASYSTQILFSAAVILKDLSVSWICGKIFPLWSPGWPSISWNTHSNHQCQLRLFIETLK